MAVGLAILSQERPALVHAAPEGKSVIDVRPGDFEGLDERMRGFLGLFGIVKIKVYDGGKKVVYSTDKTIIGKVDEANPRLMRVLGSGMPDSELVSKDKIAELRGESLLHVDVVETYVPIRVGEVIAGSIEVYIDVSPSYEMLRSAVRLSITVLLAVLAAVFAGLFFLMRKGTIPLEAVQGNLKRMATVDSLTGLANRRHLFSRIGEEYARMARTRHRLKPTETLGVVMADIDHCKKINDTHGHQAGDEVLREAASRLKSSLRSYDIIGRYGGEEFLIILPHTGLPESGLVAARMRRTISGMPFEIEGKSIAVSASFGVAHLSDDQDGVTEAIRRADEALYRAKESGRNKVVSASGGTARAEAAANPVAPAGRSEVDPSAESRLGRDAGSLRGAAPKSLRKAVDERQAALWGHAVA